MIHFLNLLKEKNLSNVLTASFGQKKMKDVIILLADVEIIFVINVVKK